MRDEKLYTVSWTQVYETWPVEQEPEMDLTEACAVLASIMAL